MWSWYPFLWWFHKETKRTPTILGPPPYRDRPNSGFSLRKSTMYIRAACSNAILNAYRDILLRPHQQRCPETGVCHRTSYRPHSPRVPSPAAVCIRSIPGTTKNQRFRITSITPKLAVEQFCAVSTNASVPERCHKYQHIYQKKQTNENI